MSTNLDFTNTEVAFAYKTEAELKNAKFMFNLFRFPFIVKYGPTMANWSMGVGLPVKGVIKQFGFNHFCGGEYVDDCDKLAKKLQGFGVGSILDYSVEGVESQAQFDSNTEEIIDTIIKASENDAYPFAVFKTTGIALFAMLEKSDAGISLEIEELNAYYRAKERFEKICLEAATRKVKLFVDAEETWIQNTIDVWAEEMMAKYNKEEVIIYNTLQMYRTDRLAYLQKQIEVAKEKGYKLGFKLVRGAYMEKERERAQEKGYPSPIQATKADSDRDYDQALRICVLNSETVAICAGTHNETSSELLAQLMDEKNFKNNDSRFWFAQLLGMSDHISFNLAKQGYNVAKYLPYGPVKAVLPYLSRRAQENSSVKGQVGRELLLIEKELKRRKKV
jgi:proline dehydrogenase